jgi:ATP-dependent RNA helicase RhlE
MFRKLIRKLLGADTEKDSASAKPPPVSSKGYSHVPSHARRGDPGGPGRSARVQGKDRDRKPHQQERKPSGPAAAGPAEGERDREKSRRGQPPPPRPDQRGTARTESGHREHDRPDRDGTSDRRGGRGGRSRGRGRDRRRDRDEHFSPAPDRDQSAQAADQRAEKAVEPVAPRPQPPAAPIEVPTVSADNEFIDLGLVPALAAATEALGYEQPTPIQSEAIPMVLAGRDVIGSAQTGTGKTAAFALPILQHLKEHESLRCLVLEPTRELASQVDEAFHGFSKFTNLRTAVVFGGVGYGPQRDALKRGLDIIVATPGRLLDLIGQGSISLKGIRYLVLDEVDRMLDMGFLPDVKRIVEMCPKDRQTLFFSATIPPELEKLASWCLRDPHSIEIGRRRSPAETVSHAFYPVIQSQKFDLLKALLEQTHYESVLIFCRTKNGADFVASRLETQGHKVAVLHSNRSQVERTDALKGFKSGRYEVMVATDLAARGLDIAGITHVINFDTPQHAEDYVHRIGRTGRAEAEGDAFTLLTEDEMKHAFAIERFIGQKVERKKLEGFPYQYSAIFASAEGDAKNVFRSRLYRGTKG